jgi:hypothetical protein
MVCEIIGLFANSLEKLRQLCCTSLALIERAMEGTFPGLLSV